jgi:hypothetical protein
LYVMRKNPRSHGIKKVKHDKALEQAKIVGSDTGSRQRAISSQILTTEDN